MRSLHGMMPPEKQQMNYFHPGIEDVREEGSGLKSSSLGMKEREGVRVKNEQ